MKIKSFAEFKNKFGYVSVITPGSINEKPVIINRFLQCKMGEGKALKFEIQILKS